MRCKKMLEMYNNMINNNLLINLINDKLHLLDNNIDSVFDFVGNGFNNIKCTLVNGELEEKWMNNAKLEITNDLTNKLHSEKTKKINQLTENYEKKLSDKESENQLLKLKISNFEKLLANKEKEYQQGMENMMNKMTKEKNEAIKKAMEEAEQRYLVSKEGAKSDWMNDFA